MSGRRSYGTTAADDESHRLLNNPMPYEENGSPTTGSPRRNGNGNNGLPIDRSNSDPQLFHDKFATHGQLSEDGDDVTFLRYRYDGHVVIIGEWLSRSKGYRLMVLGPDWPCAFGTFILLLFTTWLMFHYCVTTNVEQIMFGVIASLTLFTFLSVFISDPGLMRKYHHARSRQWTFCDQCDSFRPHATVHCSTCNVCVAGYDHHCPVSCYNFI
jgi:hypothetical protein